MHSLMINTARKITAINKSTRDENVSVILFENGSKEAFLPWFMEEKKPTVGAYLVKDKDGFTRCVATLEA